MTIPYTGETEPRFPMPARTEMPLRVAVRSLDLVAAIRYEDEFHAAWQEAVQTDSTIPLHTFLYRWAVFVELRRYPARAARLAELERTMARAEDAAGAREAASEIAALLDEAVWEITS